MRGLSCSEPATAMDRGEWMFHDAAHSAKDSPVAVSRAIAASHARHATVAYHSLIVPGIIPTFARASMRHGTPRSRACIFTTIRDHGPHHPVAHADTRINHADPLILLGRIFDACRDGEAVVVRQGERRRPGIVKWMPAPFRPAIARFHDRRGQGDAAAPPARHRATATPRPTHATARRGHEERPG